MTRDQLKDRAVASLPGGSARLDPITLIILGAILSTVIARYLSRAMDKCEHKSIRNPGFIARWQLRRAVRAGWRSPEVAAAVGNPSYSPDALDRAYGDDVHAALLRMAGSLSDAEIDSVIR